MNIRRPHILRAAAVTAACLAALCCNACRKTLTYDYRGIPVRVSFDWEGVGAKPEGMRVIFYPLDREGTPYVDNIAPDGGTVELPSGRYAVVMFNNDSETILIDGEKSFGTIRAYTRTVTTVDPSLANVGSGGGLLDARAEPAAGTPVVNRPDKLFGVSIGELSVSGETSRGSEQALRVKPAALVSQYCLCQQVVGGEFVQRVRGAVAGVPCSIMLGSQRPVAAASYIPADCAQTEGNVVTATFTCFGTAVLQEEPKPVTITLELTLPDASRQVAQTDVTTVVAQAEPSDPTTVPPAPTPVPDQIVIEYTPPEGGGGVDVGVGDWGEEIVPLPLGTRAVPGRRTTVGSPIGYRRRTTTPEAPRTGELTTRKPTS